MKRSDVIKINEMLRNRYDGCRNIRYTNDGAVTCTVDSMPNNGSPGRIFAGWDTELLAEANRD